MSLRNWNDVINALKPEMEIDMPMLAEKKKSKKSKAPKPAARAVPGADDAISKIQMLPGTETFVEIAVDLNDLIFDEHGKERTTGEENVVEIRKLATDFAHRGQLQRIGVTPFGLTAKQVAEGNYRIVWGHRRAAAATMAGHSEIKAVLRMYDSEEQLVVERGIENFHREQLGPIQEALMVSHVVGVFQTRFSHGPTAEPPEGEQPNIPMPAKHEAEAHRKAISQAAEYFGKSEGWVRDRCYLERLGDVGRRLVTEGRLPLSHAVLIAKLADPNLREELAKRYAGKSANPVEPRERPGDLGSLQREVSRSLLSLGQVPWKLDVAFAGKPACVECPHNSINKPGLFDGAKASTNTKEARSSYGKRITSEPDAGVCMLASCYREKASAANAAVRNTAKAIATHSKGQPKKERPKKITASYVAAYAEEQRKKIPAYVSPATIATQATHQLEAKAPSVSSGGAPKPSVDTRRTEAQRTASGKLQQALRARVKEFEPELSGWLAAKPGRWAMFHALRESKLWQATQAGNDKAMKKAVQAPALAHLIGLLEQPSLENLIAIERTCGTRFGLLDDWNDCDTGIVDLLAKTHSLDVSVAPTLNKFLPKEFQEKMEPGKPSSSGAGTSAKKTSTKRTGKKESAAANEPSNGSDQNHETAMDDDGGEE